MVTLSISNDCNNDQVRSTSNEKEVTNKCAEEEKALPAQIRGAGGHSNLTIPFADVYPLVGEYMQRLRQKQVIPKIAGVPPPPAHPGKQRNGESNEQYNVSASKFATRKLVLFKPWGFNSRLDLT